MPVIEVVDDDGDDAVGPLIESPAEFVEKVDTKSIRIPVVHPPLPRPVYAPLTLEPRVIPKRPNLFVRIRRAFSW